MTEPLSAPDRRRIVDATVITASYSMERWPLTIAAVESVLRQTVLPREIILPVDHNPELFNRLRAHWSMSDKANIPITVVESEYAGKLGAAVTTAAQIATSAFLVFLDDDAAAEPTWLERMMAGFHREGVIAVAGAPRPSYSRPRPGWFPHEFDWVFGCAYEGMPTESGPILHMIGTTMAVRRSDFIALGGIHLNDHGDMELSHRLLERTPGGILLYEPAAVVNHHVHAERLTWSYFWRRCFSVNRSKAGAMRHLGPAAHLAAERSAAIHVLTRGVWRNLRAIARGDRHGLSRVAAIVAGVGLAGMGYLVGSVEHRVGLGPSAEQMGWVGELRPRPEAASPNGVSKRDG